MSKNTCSMLAGFMLFCVTHHRMFACPICCDSAGNIKKPPFHEVEPEKAEKTNSKESKSKENNQEKKS